MLAVASRAGRWNAAVAVRVAVFVMMAVANLLLFMGHRAASAVMFGCRRPGLAAGSDGNPSGVAGAVLLGMERPLNA